MSHYTNWDENQLVHGAKWTGTIRDGTMWTFASVAADFRLRTPSVHDCVTLGARDYLIDTFMETAIRDSAWMWDGTAEPVSLDQRTRMGIENTHVLLS